MPCYVTGTLAGDLELDRNEIRSKLQHLTRVMCTTMEAAERDGLLPRLHNVAQVFWREHKKIDAKRRADESRRYKERRAQLLKQRDEIDRALRGGDD